MKRNKKLFWKSLITVSALILCLVISLSCLIFSVIDLERDNSEDNYRAVGHIVADSVKNVLYRPIMVAESMTQSPDIIDVLNEKKIRGTALEENHVKYLKQIHDKFGYQMVYSVSDLTRAYYTTGGFSRTLDSKITDIWYQKFVDNGCKLEIVIDQDIELGWTPTFFINAPVKDETNKFLGLCGIGVSIGDIQYILAEFEDAHDLKILLVDSQGVIKLSTNTSDIDNVKIESSYFNKVKSNDFFFEKGRNRDRLTTYLEGTGMYLVIQGKGTDTVAILRHLCPVLIIFFIALAILFVFIRIFAQNETNRNDEFEIINEIISNAELGIWVISEKSDSCFAMQSNDKMKELMGINNPSVTDEELFNYWKNNILDEEVNDVLDDFSKIQPGQFREYFYRWKHPEKGIINIRCGGTCDSKSDGTKVFIGYITDVTSVVENDKKQQEALQSALQKANDAKSAFLFNMSHDIRTPMNAIMGYTELLEKYQEDKNRRDDYLKKIKESSTILLSIINNVLEMSRIEKGALELEESAWNTRKFMDSITVVFQDIVEKKQLDFGCDINIQHEYVYCDAVKLREIFLNVISNACKYTNRGGSVHIRVDEFLSAKNDCAIYRTTITDTGIGIGKEFLPHIFEEFTREHTMTETKVEGVGIGMSIVKKMVEFLGGTINVDSNKGMGTTVVITMEHRLASPEDIFEVENDNYDYFSFEGRRILLAEDNELNAEITVKILETTGARVEQVEDGLKCIEMLSKNEPGYYDLVLMDIQMPQMDGYETTKQIRMMNDQEKASVPIFALTANVFEEDKRQAMLAGMNGHISKPINIKELMNTIASVLK